MKAPNHLDFTPEQVEDLINRLNNETLRKEDYPVLTNLLKAIIWMNLSLQEKQLSIQRLRAVFGIKTESAKNLTEFLKGQEGATDQNNESDSDETEQENQPTDSDKRKPPKKGHGHRSASDFTQAKTIHIAHQSLKKGSTCPSSKGYSPEQYTRLVGLQFYLEDVALQTQQLVALHHF